MTESRARYALAAILGAYFVIGTLYAALTPAWQVPDEPAHYNYIRQLVEDRGLPVLTSGDYDQGYLEMLKGQHFPPALSIEAVEYEDHQPPLYYLLAVPNYLLFDGALLPLRWFSLWLGGGLVVCAFFLARAVLPDRPALALTTAGFVAFLPQHVSILAGVNNDSLAGLILALTLLLLLRYTEPRPAPPPGHVRETDAWKIGVLMGMGFLTKGTVIFVPALAALALAWVWRRERWTLKHAGREALAMFLPALLIGGAWWARNVGVYGWPDFFGQIRHNAIVEGQPRTAQWIAELGWGEYLRRFAVTTFDSFWGQFGWMGVVMDRRVYWALLAFTVLVSAGWGIALAEAGRASRPSGDRGPVAWLLGLNLLCSVLLYLGYNLTFVQFQGRYLFSALIPIAVAVSLGLERLARLARPLLGRHSGWLPLAVIPLLAALDVLALFRFIIPALAS